MKTTEMQIIHLNVKSKCLRKYICDARHTRYVTPANVVHLIMMIYSVGSVTVNITNLNGMVFSTAPSVISLWGIRILDNCAEKLIVITTGAGTNMTKIRV